MRSYQSPGSRIGFALAAIAMSTLTLLLLVAIPAQIAPEGPLADALAKASLASISCRS
jgi:hypothetical protein